MEHLLFILIAGLVVIVRWLFTQGGLAKLLENLNGDLNNKTSPTTSRTPPDLRRQNPFPARPVGQETEEEKRVRKFMEALGMPVQTPTPPPSSQRPVVSSVPPKVHQPLPSRNPTPTERVRVERERIERKLAERRRQQATPPPLQKPVKRTFTENENPHEVGRFFELENFEHPTIEPEAVILESGIPPVAQATKPAARLGGILGNGSDLRRLILAQEILGRPKSLQTP